MLTEHTTVLEFDLVLPIEHLLNRLELGLNVVFLDVISKAGLVLFVCVLLAEGVITVLSRMTVIFKHDLTIAIYNPKGESI